MVDDPRPDPRDYTGKLAYRRDRDAWSKREKRRQKLAAAVAAAAADDGGDWAAYPKGHPKPGGPVPKVDIDEVLTPCKWDVLRGSWVHPVDGTIHVVERNRARQAAQRASQAWRRAEFMRIHKETERQLKELHPPCSAEAVDGDYLMKVKIDSKSLPLFCGMSKRHINNQRWFQCNDPSKSIIHRVGGYLETRIIHPSRAEYIVFRLSWRYWEIVNVLMAESGSITLAQYKHQLRMVKSEAAKQDVEAMVLAWEAEVGEQRCMESEDLPLQAERARQQAEDEAWRAKELARRAKASALNEERRSRQVQARLARMQDPDATRSITYTCDGSRALPRHPPCLEFNPVPPLDWTDKEVEAWQLDLAEDWNANPEWNATACEYCYERSRLAKGRFEEIRAGREALQLETIGDLTFQCTWKPNRLKNGCIRPCLRKFRAAAKPDDWTHKEVMGLPMHGWATCIHSRTCQYTHHLQFGYWCRDLVRGTVNRPACWLAREGAS